MYALEEIVSGYVENSTEPFQKQAASTIISKIIYAIWLGICIIANSIVIQTLSKPELYQLNFYYIIVHWSWGNVLQMIYSVYVVFVPQEITSNPNGSIFHIFHYMVSPAPVHLAACFTFDKFVNSKTFCRSSIHRNWISYGFNTVLISILVMADIASLDPLVIGFLVVLNLFSAIFVARLVFFCVKGSTEENHPFRLIMAGICVATNYGYVIWTIFDKFTNLEIPQLFGAITMVIHANGLINLILLHHKDPNVNIWTIFKQKFEKIKKIWQSIKDTFKNFKGKFNKKYSVSEQAASPSISRCDHVKINYII